MHTWYRFKKATDDGTVEVFIYDFIGDWIDHYWGFGVTAQNFLQQIRSLPDSVRTLRIRLNTPGGDVFSSLAIANLLRDQRIQGRQVETQVDGIAASGGSIIMMAGDPVLISDNGLVMIHNPSSGMYGQAKEFRKAAETLDAIQDAIVATYKWHSRLSAKDIAALMEEETWMTANQAVGHGFATGIVVGLVPEATFAKSALSALNPPSRFLPQLDACTHSTPRFGIAKTNPAKKQVFGWASVALTANGEVIVDGHEHIIEPHELENAAYLFNLHHREGDVEHTGPVEGLLIESLVVTPEKLEVMGLPQNALPQGWWVGFQLSDDAVFQKVVSGEYRMFSIAGTANLVPVEE